MDAGETTVDACPECHGGNPWIYENDEYNCRHCGHIRVGDFGARFRDEGEYVQPLTEIYFKNPVYRDSVTDRPLSAHLQKVESDLYRQVLGCVRNTLNLPESVAQRAWNILGIVRKKQSKLKVTQSVKNLAMSVALFAGRESGHQVSDLAIAALIGKDLAYVKNDLQMICKTLGRPWVDFRGVNEYAIKVIQVADDIAQLFIGEVDLAEEVTKDKYFRNTQDFCAAYHPHIDSVYEYSEKVERLAEVTGVWQNRTPDYCTIASVFIGLEMASRLYQHQTRLFTDELGKHIFFNPTSWQPRTREIQRVAMDLAFYLPQIGKARVVPELVTPWRGRMARPLPIGQVFILLLPDVLDNMDALWDKREQDLERGKDADSKRDVEARLKNALSAFLPPIPDEEPPTASDRNVQDDGRPRQAEAEASVQLSTGHALTTPNVSGSAYEPAPKRSRSMPRNMDRSTPPLPSSKNHRSTSLPRDTFQVTTSSLSVEISDGVSPAVAHCDSQPSASKLSPKNRKRKRSAKGPDMRRKENRPVDPAKERQMQLDIRQRFEQRLTEKQSREVARQHSQREVGIGVKNADFMKSGRVVYGRRRFGLLDTGAFQRLPEVTQFLREWQTREAGSGVNMETPDDIDDQDHGRQLRHDLRKGADPMTIPTFRFPTSLAMAKAMLSNANLDSPNVGSDDDMYFDDGELDGYLGDDHFQKARLEMWKAQGLNKFEKKDTIFSQRALDMASKRDSRVAGLVSGKSKTKEKLDSARLAAVMESFREDSELRDIDPVLRKEFGRSVVQAAMQAEGTWEDGSQEINAYDVYGTEDRDDELEGYENEADDKVDELESEYRSDEDQSGNGAAYVPMNQEDDDAFEVVGDLDDYVG